MAPRRKNPSGPITRDVQLSFEQTDLWRAAFESNDAHRYPSPAAFFRQALLRVREKVLLLVGQIANDIPQLTVHDITHLDALWEIGSLIAGPCYVLNPAEGYVLGAAILLHDSAMTLGAYPGGLEDLTQTDEWRDTLVAFESGDNDSSAHRNPNEERSIKLVLPLVLRSLHARQAESLPFVQWKSSVGSEYLIDDPDLREFYGRVIGRIAKSHNDSATSLPVSMGTPIGAIAAAPPEWSVDPLKIACLSRLRAAGAYFASQWRSLEGRDRGGSLLHRSHGSHGSGGQPYRGLSDHRWNRAFQGCIRRPYVELDVDTSGVRRR